MHMEGVSHCPQGSYSVYLYTFFQAAVACLQNIESDKLKKMWRLSGQAKEKGYLLDKKNLKWQEFKCENREKKTCKMLGHPTVTGLGPAVADTNSALWGGPELLALLLRSEAPGPLPAGGHLRTADPEASVLLLFIFHAERRTGANDQPKAEITYDWHTNHY